jgi:hypothetical protein
LSFKNPTTKENFLDVNLYSHFTYYSKKEIPPHWSHLIFS